MEKIRILELAYSRITFLHKLETKHLKDDFWHDIAKRKLATFEERLEEIRHLLSKENSKDISRKLYEYAYQELVILSENKEVILLKNPKDVRAQSDLEQLNQEIKELVKIMRKKVKQSGKITQSRILDLAYHSLMVACRGAKGFNDDYNQYRALFLKKQLDEVEELIEQLKNKQ